MAFDRLEFGRRLAEQRKRAGFDTQRRFAESADIGFQMISFYEKGSKIPCADTLSRLARAAGCSADYLLQIGEEQPV